MELGDQKLLRAAQSRTVSLGEFNFDQLTARPLMSFLDMNDISKLESIATSIRYAGNPKKKKKEIQSIMKARGFDPAYMSGTNRVTFKHYEDPSIVMKIAIDDIGRQDNPREFFNQNVLKPFVCKVFEVAGNGVVALVERVDPIKTREEFLSVADDIHKVIWLLTKRYIISDFGSHYPFNWSIRRGWGVCLCDYPMVYEPNRDMLICHSVNMNTGQECGGLIDYDEGYNALICTKCGVKYNASDIAKILKENEIIVKAKERGNVKMKVGIVRGNKKTTLLDTTNMGTGIIRPAVDNITVPQTTEVVQEPEPVKTVRVNINTTLANAEEQKNHKPGGGRVSVKRTPVSVKKHDNGSHNGGYNKSRNFNGKSNGVKIKISRDGNRLNNTKKEYVPGPKSAVAITAVNIKEIANTNFKFSSYDAENGLVFVSGKTPSGSDLKVHFECKDAEGFAKELGIEPEAAPVQVDSEVSTAVMELEQAKKDLLSQEEKNITLTNELNATKEALEAAKKTIDTIGDASDKDEEIAKLKEDLSKAEAVAMEAESLKIEIERLKEVPDFSEDLAAKDAEIIELKSTLEAASKRLESLELNMEERENSIKDLTEQLEAEKADKVIKSNDPTAIEKERLILIHADMYNAIDFLTDDEKENYDGPEHILALADTYDTVDDNGNDIVKKDFIRDGEEKLLCISHINDVPVDYIKFVIGKPVEDEE